MDENQRLRELAIVANPLENRLFLASVTMPTLALLIGVGPNHRLIPGLTAHDPWAQSRMPMDMMRQG
jgi:hypothetical protein